MEFIKLGREDTANISYLLHLAPESMLQELRLKGQYALALGLNHDDDGDIKENEIIGLVCFYMNMYDKSNRSLVIRWFYVMPEFRERGYGRRLMEKIGEIALENKISQIRATFPDIEDTNIFKFLFYEMDFTYIRGDIVERYTTIDELSELEIMKMFSGKNIKSDDVIPLSVLHNDEFRRLYMSIPDSRKNLEEYWLPDRMEYYDMDVSVVKMDNNGELEGIFLFRNINEALEPVILYTEKGDNTKLLYLLISNSYYRGLQKYSDDYSIKIRSTKATKKAIFDVMLKDLAYCSSLQGVMELQP